MKPVIIGGGLAGLTTALALAPRPVILLSAKKLGTECSSAWAQGGIAACVGDDDTPDLHTADTLKAGAGLCDTSIVQRVTQASAEVIARLRAQGVVFDHDANGKLRLGLEAAHNRRRIVHAKGDGTGLAIMQALITTVQNTPSIQVIENAVATDLLTNDGICGVAIECDGIKSVIPTRHIVLATGGAGALWQHTTNPLTSWGRGLALAARAGAVLGDLEFMQFHPTAMDVGRDPMPLASEALRGEGAFLIDEKGTRFMAGYGKAELEPRDIVARAIWDHIAQGHRVFLDARPAIGPNFPSRFPAVYALCQSAGLDPVRQPIPVRPAAHYHMGGVVTDAKGRTNVKGLWACGEVACTGLHGANRLASNSLLEAVAFGRHVADDIAGVEEVEPKSCIQQPIATTTLSDQNTKNQIRAIMSNNVGVRRDKAGLENAITQLSPLAAHSDMALVGLMIAMTALRRDESRGAQARTDFPEPSEAWKHRQTITLADVIKTGSLPQKQAIGV